MTTNELNEILDDENRKLTLNELEEIIYTLKKDCWEEYYKNINNNRIDDITNYFYTGEVNAFYICLDLIKHLKGEN